MSSIPSHQKNTPRARKVDIAALIPDFPFHYGAFLDEAKRLDKPLFELPPGGKEKKVLIVGAGVAGAIAAYELLRMGLKPILVEGSGRIGGRLNAHRCAPDTPEEVIAELGAMRFPKSGKAGLHYFGKAGMTDPGRCADFPNPGSPAAVCTVVDYQGETKYYEVGDEEGAAEYPKPPEYDALENAMFGEGDGWLDQKPIDFYAVQDAMSAAAPDEAKIKQVWNALINDHGWDDVSFYGGLINQSRWTKAQIDLFGQIGFGTGGWNTDYPNGFLEVLRVLYTGLDVDHQLMYDGTTTLPDSLIRKTPAQLGDPSDPATSNTSVWETTRENLQNEFPDDPTPLNKEVRHFQRLEDGTIATWIIDTRTGIEVRKVFDAVIYTPHLRVLDKFRSYPGKIDGGETTKYKATTELFDQTLWEAIQYTHYMQSAKIFVAVKEPFWEERHDPEPGKKVGKRKMGITLSDRLPRGTYLVSYDYPDGTKRHGIFLSYTWNDDSVKFDGDRNIPQALLTHVQMCIEVLEDIYPGLNLHDYLVNRDDAQVEINWENQPLFLGAFKMNLPGDYEKQRRLFSQFMDGINSDGTPTATADRFVLAGDDVSWVAGWIEGAISTAINAVNKVAVVLGGKDIAGNRGPIARWTVLQPVERKNHAPHANA
ncbi:FAD-dependent oxidoreductase [Burkholderia cenocepacia]|uniref:flavin monoamine oxidase family protein n=1 Tax=Burkholderia cenocepacia TaxID=95486 RepID=UPI001F3E8938|nr:FAD-dependent oxidoreductase [Burkholderia cenocepacia]MCF1369967.1 FAD-dependent oxidoreductase [Burkholderia cenocepacia]MCF1386002.1 FAD-dependent oxidoreductase [Burkholderia cenocepacia]MDR8074133.1 FAD-dependent oxidoreductase [Burkholderia cenocepacia]